MMLNLRRHHRAYIRTTLAVIVTAAIALSIVWLIPGTRGAAHRAMLPLWQAGEQLGAWSEVALSSFTSRARLARENERLRDELWQLQLDLLELPILRAENERLQELWERRSYERSIAGRVLARPNNTPYDTLVIDTGSRNGVSEGDVALVGGVAIGSVSSVFSNTSLVRLFSAPGVVTNISIADSDVFIEARGLGSGNFVSEVPRDIAVQEGDPIIFPDTSNRVFATVEEIVADASDPFRTVHFKLPVNLSKIDWVEIVTEGARPLPTEQADVVHE